MRRRRTQKSGPPPWLASLRKRAIEIFHSGIAAADPQKAVQRALWVQEGQLEILLEPDRDPLKARKEPWTKVSVVAFGKAACSMAQAVTETLPRDLFPGPGIAITYEGNVREVSGFQVLGAGHPIPDSRGLEGARIVAEIAGDVGHGELLLVLISGGGSALLVHPVEGISLEDKIATTEHLLASGADIGELNTVRKHLSALKGGGLARLAAPASLHSLILSDVIGDDLSTVASGPTVPDPTTFSDAVEVLQRRGVWDRIPDAVRAHLLEGRAGKVPETPKPGDPLFSWTGATLVGSNRISLEAAETAAGAGQRTTGVLTGALCGEARREAERFVEAASKGMRESAGRPLAILAGGETTVIVRGKGQGGRNLELALAFALHADRRVLPTRWVFLSGGTDGRDGPTDAAGGIVDPWSLERMRAAGLDPDALLDDNDSYRALEASGDLVRTGPTGTNVADLQILLAE